MANTPQSKKRVRQAEQRRRHNASRRSSMRTALKKVVRALETKDLPSAKTHYQLAVSALDKLAQKGLIHANKAARHKSRLIHRIKALEAA